MKKIISGVLFACLMMITTAGLAQEQEEGMLKAKKMEGHSWHQVVMVKFKPGTLDSAKSIINNHFAKAGMESGMEGPQMIQFKTGEWDMMFIWRMNDIADLEWEIHPDDEKWWAQMVKQEGGADKAGQIWQSYMDMIDNSTLYLATSQQQMPDKSTGNN